MFGEIDASKGMFRKGNVSAGDKYFPNYDKVIPYTVELAKRLADSLQSITGDEERLNFSFTAHFDLVFNQSILRWQWQNQPIIDEFYTGLL